MKYGIIGFGNMARMLINGLIEFNDVDENDICVSRHNKDKLDEINEFFPEVYVFDNNLDVARYSRIIFICVKPKDVKKVLLEIKDKVKANNHLIFLTPTVMIEDVEKIVPAQVTKLVPSITSYCGQGISLVCHGERVSKRRQNSLNDTLFAFSSVKEVSEQDMPMATVLTSCMPGLIGAIFGNMSQATKHYSTTLNHRVIKDMLIETIKATALLVDATDGEFSSLVKGVATKGGLTAEGVKVFDEKLPEVYGEVFDKILSKYQETTAIIAEDFRTE